MDGRRFDSLARSLASGASRRLVVKAIAGSFVAAVIGFGAPRRVGAQQNVPIGGRCSAFGANSECSQAGTPAGGVAVICSDNGIARDGAFNCCRNAGGVCTADFHCCGAALCTNGICGGGGTSTPPATGNGLALGAECTSTSQCSQTGGSVVCADNGLLRDGAKNCCRNQGGSCTSDFQCCASLFCVNGVCGGSSSSGSGNLAPGAACTSTSQCSQAGGSVVCADNGIASDGAMNCCRNAGGACTDTVRSADCCGGLYCRNGVCTDLASTGDLPIGSACSAADECSQDGGAVVCADNGLADDGATNCCRNAGGACTSQSHCCGGASCVNSVCSGGSTSGGGGTLALGAACTEASQCDQSGGTVACADNGIASDGALNCCRYEGGACSGGAACCGGLVCTDGVCTSGQANGGGGGGDLPLGSSCTSADQCSQAGGEVACADNGIATDGALNCCRFRGGACTTANSSAGCCAGLTCVDGTCQ